ncbi:3-hydroxyacyl-CoA dehydrogenase NAD-binding domain-containing protein [Cellulomonas marina]|uniref:enoyl-CoA hydratase n=1 Tax=Cellulomonas marina TaxID=988821 RepID=A0A1I0W364_9CELL|nr:3-hydroxyacyl-CoA dehydrogenase NAD-binding domain-containing protein [Cellulomonas marina]GIG29964.1 3-hydroxyacyl-CoA dehydrogenase [Cellulomonas marina]SFA83159.1 3-hydroxyacyl-CoA dehydrogenase [Cellulomonas marina]
MSTERATTVRTQRIALPYGGTALLLTLVPWADPSGGGPERPATLGLQGLAALQEAVEAAAAAVARGGVDAVAVTGSGRTFLAGADLSQVTTVRDRADALALARAGHAAYDALAALPVPTVALVNGAALGGGLELALACDARVVSSGAGALGLPETALGLVPGWGGAYRLPRLVGIAGALDVVLDRPAANRVLRADEALALGLVDAVLPAEGFPDEALAWVGRLVRGEVQVERRALDDAEIWDAAVAAARERLDATVHGSRPAPGRALELLAAARTATPAEAWAAEDEALADLVMTDEMRASVYATALVRGARRTAGAPDPALARPVTRVGLVGAGLMAAQIAALLATRLGVPVVLRDLDDERVAAGLAAVRATLDRAVRGGRLRPADAATVAQRVTGTTDVGDLAGCDLVVEAVTEVLDLKRRVLAELEPVVGPDCVLATNTSALSVTAMAADLAHPERVVGLHFFNPVAAMPLVEVVRGGATSPAALATAVAVATGAGKSAVLVGDRPGFVVNRLLILLLGVVLDAVERGTPVEVANTALDPLGLPMRPFALLDLVGPAVGLHVLTSLRADLGDAFPRSPGLEAVVAGGVRLVGRPPAPGWPAPLSPDVQATFDAARDGSVPLAPLDAAGVRAAVGRALAREVGRLLDEGVVADPTQVDVAMLLGAGWPVHLGGITPWLDRAGWSTEMLGRRLQPPGRADVPRPAPA